MIKFHSETLGSSVFKEPSERQIAEEKLNVTEAQEEDRPIEPAACEDTLTEVGNHSAEIGAEHKEIMYQLVYAIDLSKDPLRQSKS